MKCSALSHRLDWIGRCAERHPSFLAASHGFELNVVDFLAQAELTGREVSLHNQKLALESVVKELQDAKQTIDRFRCKLLFSQRQ